METTIFSLWGMFPKRDATASLVASSPGLQYMLMQTFKWAGMIEASKAGQHKRLGNAEYQRKSVDSIHPASRGVAAHTAGFFFFVRDRG